MRNRISGAALVHLEKELGSELAEFTFNPENTDLVRDAIEKAKNGNTTNFEWNKLFGHLSILHFLFNQKLYPLGVDDNTKAEEFSFDRTISGHEALVEFNKMGRKTASLWAQGRYINDNPNTVKGLSLIGIGARREIPMLKAVMPNAVRFPGFIFLNDDVPFVTLCRPENHFCPDSSFLLQVEED